MKKSNMFKGIKIQNDTAEHTLYCINQDTMMTFYVMANDAVTIDEMLKMDCEAAFNEIFAAHRLFEGEAMFRRKGGEIKIAINGHTFVSEGYDETSIALDHASTFKLVTLSTKGGYTTESLYQFHDDIREFLKINTVEL